MEIQINLFLIIDEYTDSTIFPIKSFLYRINDSSKEGLNFDLKRHKRFKFAPNIFNSYSEIS